MSVSETNQNRNYCLAPFCLFSEVVGSCVEYFFLSWGGGWYSQAEGRIHGGLSPPR